MSSRRLCGPGRLLRLLAVLVITLIPEPLPAVVSGTPHDLVSQGYDVDKPAIYKDTCGPCHVPVRRKGWDLLARVPASLGEYGSESLLCFSCHDGTTFVDSVVDASMTAFHPLSHGYDTAGLGPGFTPPPDLLLLDEGGMSCMSCHDPHDNRYRPFLRIEIALLCRACHEDKVELNSGTGNETGNHPIEIDPVEAPREDVPLLIDAETYRTAFPQPYPAAGGRFSPGVHWDLGGHLAGGAEGGVDCITCHAVHGDEATPPLRALLSRDPVRAVADEFCEGCHRGERGDGKKTSPAPNPGGTVTGRTYHPSDDDEANGPDRSLEITEPSGWPFGEGTPPRLLCVTCHRPHGAATGTALLRPVDRARGFCEVCHEDAPSRYHHPLEIKREKSCAASPATGGGQMEEYLRCESCHRAHNAGFDAENEEGFIPLLRNDLLAEDYCMSCHPEEDPTCGAPEGGTASHFLGDPTVPSTYDKVDPSIRTEPWPESGLPSMYGGASGKAIICLSCHSFREGALTEEDDIGARHLVARSGPDVEWQIHNEQDEGDTGIYLCTGCHSANPSTNKSGHTHPLMSADVTKLTQEPAPPMTSTPGGHLNCDSCHYPHGALDKGGYYIMKVVDGPNSDPRAIHPEIDYTATCHQCHSVEDY